MAGSRRQQRVVAQDLEKVSLGDPRRERRAVALAERLAAGPEATLPFAMVDRAMLEAAYRHLSTRVVTFDALLAPHVEKTAARVGEAGDVYAVHDTTICMFSGEVQPSGLGTVNLADQGFLAHVTLAVAADGTRLPFGVLAAELLVRTERKHTRRRHHFYRTKDADKESQRWKRGIDRASEVVKSPEQLIHVADREGDILSYRTLWPSRHEEIPMRISSLGGRAGIVPPFTSAPAMPRGAPGAPRKCSGTSAQ